MASFALLLLLAAAQVLAAAVAHRQVAAAVHKRLAAVLVSVLVAAVGWDSMSDKLAAALVAELDLLSSRSNNRHY